MTFVRKTGSVAFDNFVISKGSELDFVESLQVSGEGGKNQVKIGNTLQMVVTFIPPDSSVTVVAWSVKNPDGTDTDKAIIDPVTGLLTALKAGDVRVIATALDGSGVTGYATIHIPTPGYLVTISANYTPDVGETFVVTFTVKDSEGDVDASFNGVITVTASGVTASPGGTYGTVNGSVINGGAFSVSVTFTNGKGSLSLTLHNAADQSISFNFSGIVNPYAGLSVTPVHSAPSRLSPQRNINPLPNENGEFTVQPVLTVRDSYGNICTRDNSTVVTASRGDKQSCFVIPESETAKSICLLSSGETRKPTVVALYRL